MVKIILPLLSLVAAAEAFTLSSTSTSHVQVPVVRLLSQSNDNDMSDGNNNVNTNNNTSQRRQFVSQIVSSAALMISSKSAYAEDDTTTTITTESTPAATPATTPTKRINKVEMKTFVDPKGLFAINVPKSFFAIRRTVKGDLPDEKTGKGRRGSSIFTAGDMAKAEVVAIERFPTKVLLEEEGIIPSGDLSTFTSIGNPTSIANLIALRRDRDKQTQARTIVLPNSVSTSPDGKTLYFSLSQSIDVQKPELLMEQTGYSELVRLTLAKASLDSNDGQMMAVFASALQQDYAGEDGPALIESVDSFVALDQSNKK
jgi:hypothetical protein